MNWTGLAQSGPAQNDATFVERNLKPIKLTKKLLTLTMEILKQISLWMFLWCSFFGNLITIFFTGFETKETPKKWLVRFILNVLHFWNIQKMAWMQHKSLIENRCMFKNGSMILFSCCKKSGYPFHRSFVANIIFLFKQTFFLGTTSLKSTICENLVLKSHIWLFW